MKGQGKRWIPGDRAREGEGDCSLGVQLGPVALKSTLFPREIHVPGPVQPTGELRGGLAGARATGAGDRVRPVAAGATAFGLQARRRTAGLLSWQARSGGEPDPGTGRRRAQAVDAAVTAPSALAPFDLSAWSAARLQQVE